MAEKPVCAVKGCEEEGLAFVESSKRWLCSKHWREARLKMEKEQARKVAARRGRV